MLEVSRGHEANFVFGQVRADLRRVQIAAAYGQERISAGLRNVIENVVFRRQSDSLLYVRGKPNRISAMRMSYWGRECVHW